MHEAIKQHKFGIFTRWASQSKPDLHLYHYTTANAVLSMLKEKTVRATHTDYLNDLSEVHHGQGLIDDRLQVATGDGKAGAMLKIARETIDQSQSRWNHYVFCMSERHDDLTQWRAYANRGRGFAMEFNFFRSDFRTLPLRERMFMQRVIYSNRDKIASIDAVITSFTDLHQRLTNDFPAYEVASEVGITCAEVLMLQRTFFKDSRFESEHEWRLVVTNPDEKEVITRARGDGNLVREVHLPFSEQPWRTPEFDTVEGREYLSISGIRLGSPLSRSTEPALRAALLNFGFEVSDSRELDASTVATHASGVFVSRSEIPML